MAEQGFRKWIITLTVIFASLMELLDTTVVNVSLPDIMGNLGASIDSIGWVVTSYSVAIVIVLPMSGWIASRVGRKNYFLASILLFTTFSFFCGHAQSLNELIFFRFMQGLAGGGMAPTAQAILLEAWPPDQIGMATALFGLGVVVGPTIGPVLGGYITDHFSWPWIFYVNIPVCVIASFMISTFIRETPRDKKGTPIDYWGILLLAISVGSLQIVLEKGESEDWFNTTYIIVLAFLAIIAGISFIWRELTTDHPVVEFSILRHRSFTIGIFTTFIFGLGMFGSVFVYPLMLQNLLGFTAEQTGIISIPSGVTTIIMMPWIGVLLKKGFPAQIMTTLGMIVFFWFCLMMSKTTLSDGVGNFFLPMVIRGLGTSMLFVPIITLAVQDLRGREIGQGTGLNSMMRQLGGSFGIALITTFLDRRVAFHRGVLMNQINPYNLAFNSRLKTLQAAFQSQGNGALHARQMAYQAIEGFFSKQVLLLSYADVFWIVGIFFLCTIPVLYLQKFRSTPAIPAGAH